MISATSAPRAQLATASSSDPNAADELQRRRLRRACDWCRTSRRKCNLERPCANCALRGEECTFDLPWSTRGKGKRKREAEQADECDDNSTGDMHSCQSHPHKRQALLPLIAAHACSTRASPFAVLAGASPPRFGAHTPPSLALAAEWLPSISSFATMGGASNSPFVVHGLHGAFAGGGAGGGSGVGWSLSRASLAFFYGELFCSTINPMLGVLRGGRTLRPVESLQLAMLPMSGASGLGPGAALAFQAHAIIALTARALGHLTVAQDAWARALVLKAQLRTEPPSLALVSANWLLAIFASTTPASLADAMTHASDAYSQTVTLLTVLGGAKLAPGTFAWRSFAEMWLAVHTMLGVPTELARSEMAPAQPAPAPAPVPAPAPAPAAAAAAAPVPPVVSPTTIDLSVFAKFVLPAGAPAVFPHRVFLAPDTLARTMADMRAVVLPLPWAAFARPVTPTLLASVVNPVAAHAVSLVVAAAGGTAPQLVALFSCVSIGPEFVHTCTVTPCPSAASRTGGSSSLQAPPQPQPPTPPLSLPLSPPLSLPLTPPLSLSLLRGARPSLPPPDADGSRVRSSLAFLVGDAADSSPPPASTDSATPDDEGHPDKIEPPVCSPSCSSSACSTGSTPVPPGLASPAVLAAASHAIATFLPVALATREDLAAGVPRVELAWGESTPLLFSWLAAHVTTASVVLQDSELATFMLQLGLASLTLATPVELALASQAVIQALLCYAICAVRLRRADQLHVVCRVLSQLVAASQPVDEHLRLVLDALRELNAAD